MPYVNLKFHLPNGNIYYRYDTHQYDVDRLIYIDKSVLITCDGQVYIKKIPDEPFDSYVIAEICGNEIWLEDVDN